MGKEPSLEWSNQRSSSRLAFVPLLFSVCVDDLLEGLESYLNMYSGDGRVMREVRSSQEYDNLQRALYKLQLWPDAWMVKFNRTKYKVVKMEHSERRFSYDSACWKQITGMCGGVGNLYCTPEHHTRRFVKGVNHSLINIKPAFKCKYKIVFRKLCTTYTISKLE